MRATARCWTTNRSRNPDRGIPLDPGLAEGAALEHHRRAGGHRARAYSSGVHWTFCQTARPRRSSTLDATRPSHVRFQRLSIDHLMASSAIPFLFPATRLGSMVARHFGDGSMRQVTPLSPAMHLGAGASSWSAWGSRRAPASWRRARRRHRIAAGQHGRPRDSQRVPRHAGRRQVDQRVTQTINRLPRRAAAAMPQDVDVLAIAPTRRWTNWRSSSRRPSAIRDALGCTRRAAWQRGHPGPATCCSSPSFVQTLIEMGRATPGAARRSAGDGCWAGSAALGASQDCRARAAHRAPADGPRCHNSTHAQRLHARQRTPFQEEIESLESCRGSNRSGRPETPTPEEKGWVKRYFGPSIPRRYDGRDIEESARFYTGTTVTCTSVPTS